MGITPEQWKSIKAYYQKLEKAAASKSKSRDFVYYDFDANDPVYETVEEIVEEAQPTEEEIELDMDMDDIRAMIENEIAYSQYLWKNQD